jgi:predicted DNA-binding WGR domain protein
MPTAFFLSERLCYTGGDTHLNPNHIEEPMSEKKKAVPKKAAAKKEAPKKEAVEKEEMSPPPAAPSSSSAGARRFEYTDDTSNKYWEISVAGSDVTVHFGRIGTDGQTKTKSFDSTAKAEQHAAKLIEEKTGKGYEEVTGGD